MAKHEFVKQAYGSKHGIIICGTNSLPYTVIPCKLRLQALCCRQQACQSCSGSTTTCCAQAALRRLHLPRSGGSSCMRSQPERYPMQRSHSVPESGIHAIYHLLRNLIYSSPQSLHVQSPWPCLDVSTDWVPLLHGMHNSVSLQIGRRIAWGHRPYMWDSAAQIVSLSSSWHIS